MPQIMNPTIHARQCGTQALPQSKIYNHRSTSRRRFSSLRAAAASEPQNTAITGIFLRDTSKSDLAAYQRALGLLELGKLQQLTALQLIEGLELQQTGDWITLRFLTVVPFFNVQERYSLTSISTNKRRDLRPGTQKGQAKIEEDGTLVLSSSWEAPNEGNVEEKLKLLPDGQTLQCVSALSVGKGREMATQFYSKVASWKPKYSWNPLKALEIMSKNS